MFKEIQRIMSSIAIAFYLVLNVAFWPILLVTLGYLVYKSLTNPEGTRNFFGRFFRRTKKVVDVTSEQASAAKEDLIDLHNSAPNAEAPSDAVDPTALRDADNRIVSF